LPALALLSAANEMHSFTLRFQAAVSLALAYTGTGASPN
jgi:hypothetical protein